MTNGYQGKPERRKQKRPLTERRCLGCLQMFMPKHDGEYFHPRCKVAGDSSGMSDYALHTPKVAAR